MNLLPASFLASNIWCLFPLPFPPLTRRLNIFPVPTRVHTCMISFQCLLHVGMPLVSHRRAQGHVLWVARPDGSALLGTATAPSVRANLRLFPHFLLPPPFLTADCGLFQSRPVSCSTFHLCGAGSLHVCVPCQSPRKRGQRGRLRESGCIPSLTRLGIPALLLASLPEP